MKSKKARIAAVLVMCLAVVSFTSCNKNNQDVPQEVKSAFNEQYPNAKRAVWEVEGDYYEVTFKENKTTKIAWYANRNNVEWVMTKTCLHALDFLPEAIRNSFRNSIYVSWHLDDVDIIERPGVEIIYVLEVENNSVEVELHYNASGLLINVITETDGHHQTDSSYFLDTLPDGIMQYINAFFPNAMVLDIEIEHDHIEVKILFNNIVYELEFSHAGLFIHSEIDD